MGKTRITLENIITNEMMQSLGLKTVGLSFEFQRPDYISIDIEFLHHLNKEGISIIIDPSNFTHYKFPNYEIRKFIIKEILTRENIEKDGKLIVDGVEYVPKVEEKKDACIGKYGVFFHNYSKYPIDVKAGYLEEVDPLRNKTYRIKGTKYWYEYYVSFEMWLKDIQKSIMKNDDNELGLGIVWNKVGSHFINDAKIGHIKKAACIKGSTPLFAYDDAVYNWYMPIETLVKEINRREFLEE